MTAADRDQIAFAAAVTALFAAGIVFRSWGVLVGALDFWADEAWWIELTGLRSLAEPSIRPVGYLWLSQQLLGAGDRELVLRLPSLLAGIGAVVCVYFSARHLTPHRLLIVLAVALIAFNPRLVAFSKEFKPYSLEVFVHSAFTLWALVCLHRQRVPMTFWVAALAALPFCYNLVFLYPGLAATILSLRLRESAAWQRLHWKEWGAVAIVAAGILIAAYFVLSDLFNIAARRAFWGEKYGVFPLETGFLGGIAWYAQKTWALVTYAAALRGWSGVGAQVLMQTFGIAYLVGVVALFLRRRWVESILLVGPVVFVIAANLLGFWPYGPFRTNLFLVPTVVLVACYGLYALATPGWPRAAVSVVVAALLVLALPAGFDAYRMKHMRDGAPSPQLGLVLDTVARRHAEAPKLGRDVVIADWHSWRPLAYYLQSDDDYAALRAHVTLVRGPVDDIDVLATLLADARDVAAQGVGDTRVWLVVTKLESLAPILENPIVTTYEVDRTLFATHDPSYHPVLVELRFPARMAGAR